MTVFCFIYVLLFCFAEHPDDLACDMDLSEPSGSATPSSSCSLDNGGHSPSGQSESPASPGVENISPDQLPFSIGVCETNPYGCPHCEKAFPRHSYLKLHEQVSQFTYMASFPYSSIIC